MATATGFCDLQLSGISHLPSLESRIRCRRVSSRILPKASSLWVILTRQFTVQGLILKNRWIPEDRVEAQIAWFYNELGIDDVYFQLEKTDVIADHITSMYAAKVAAASRKDKREEIRLDMEAKDHAIYIDTSEPGKSAIGGPRFETRLESKYLDGDLSDRFRVETFRSSGALSDPSESVNAESRASLRCYFVYQCQFVEPKADPQETRLEVISDLMFLAKATDNTKQMYR